MTDDRSRYGEMCRYRRNRVCCKKRFCLKWHKTTSKNVLCFFAVPLQQNKTHLLFIALVRTSALQLPYISRPIVRYCFTALFYRLSFYFIARERERLMDEPKCCVCCRPQRRDAVAFSWSTECSCSTCRDAISPTRCTSDVRMLLRRTTRIPLNHTTKK